jgi:hypothetical protein
MIIAYNTLTTKKVSTEVLDYPHQVLKSQIWNSMTVFPIKRQSVHNGMDMILAYICAITLPSPLGNANTYAAVRRDINSVDIYLSIGRIHLQYNTKLNPKIGEQ